MIDTQNLYLLEQAIEPYRRVGFIVTSQSERAITLVYPPEKFSYLVFIIALILFWPAAIFYLILFNRKGERSVCIRITSQGYIEESGYTLEAVERERRRERWITLAIIGIPTLLVLAAIALLLLRYNLK
jgi:hypothetical protein